MAQVTNSLNQCHRIESVRFVFHIRWRGIAVARGRIKMIRGNISDIEWWHQFDIFQSLIHPSQAISERGNFTFQWTESIINQKIKWQSYYEVGLAIYNHPSMRNIRINFHITSITLQSIKEAFLWYATDRGWLNLTHGFLFTLLRWQMKR